MMLRLLSGVVMTPLRLVLPSRPHLLPVSDEPAPMDGVQDLRDKLLRETVRADEAVHEKNMAVLKARAADASYEAALNQIRRLALRLAVYEPDEDGDGDGLPVAGMHPTRP